jgi:hypothetical protein
MVEGVYSGWRRVMLQTADLAFLAGASILLTVLGAMLDLHLHLG